MLRNQRMLWIPVLSGQNWTFASFNRFDRFACVSHVFAHVTCSAMTWFQGRAVAYSFLCKRYGIVARTGKRWKSGLTTWSNQRSELPLCTFVWPWCHWCHYAIFLYPLWKLVTLLTSFAILPLPPKGGRRRGKKMAKLRLFFKKKLKSVLQKQAPSCCQAWNCSCESMQGLAGAI